MACRGGSPNAVENKSFIIKKGQHSFSNVFYSLKNSRFSLARCFISVTCYTFCSLSYTTQHLINIYISWNLPISPIFVLFRKCIQKVCDRSAITVMGRHRHKRCFLMDYRKITGFGPISLISSTRPFKAIFSNKEHACQM